MSQRLPAEAGLAGAIGDLLVLLTEEVAAWAEEWQQRGEDAGGIGVVLGNSEAAERGDGKRPQGQPWTWSFNENAGEQVCRVLEMALQ